MIFVYYVLWLALWFSLNGEISVNGFVFGICTVLLLDLLTSRVRQKSTAHAVRALPQLFSSVVNVLVCAVLLLRNILFGSLEIIRVLLSREIELEPCLVHLPCTSQNLKSHAARFVFSLSRGVIPVLECEDEMTLHVLNRNTAQRLTENIEGDLQ